MRRWMIGTAVLGTFAGAAHGQTGTIRATGDVSVRGEGPRVEVIADSIVLAQAATPAPAAQPGAPRAVPVAPPPPPTGAAPAPGVANVPPPTPVAAQPMPNVMMFRTTPPKLEKVTYTYLGAVTSSAPAAMRDQLKLAPGTGLVVERVEPGTPAEAAGLKQHDLLERLDDQLLINPQQLAALLRSKHAGDEVTLAIVRQGERQSVKAKLDEKEVDVNAYRANGGRGDVLPIQALAVDPNGVTRVPTGAAPAPVPAYTNWAFDGVPGKRVTVRTVNDGTQTTVWADDEVSISIERRGGKTTNMVIRDKKTDKPLYTGNGDGVEKLLDARPELKEKVKKAQDAANHDAARLQVAPAPKGGAAGGFGGGGFGAFGVGGAGGKVLRWQDDDHVLLMRMSGRSPAYLLALSRKDGRTVFDGPVANDDDRRSVPAEIAEQFQMICAQPDVAQELGAGDRPAAAPETLPRSR